MKRLRLSFAICLMVSLLLTMAAPTTVLASPAHPHRDKICWVHDANGVQYTDFDCDWMDVVKYDENGNEILLQYHDHGHLPPGAALPDRAIRMVFHVDCNCKYDGDYQEILMPNGAYMSHGPMQPTQSQ
jgi:hypothetical protein